MATQTITQLIDDIDGTEADETVHFGLDGRNYEIDLTEAHVDELRDALQPYIDVARKAGVTATPSRARPTASASNGRLGKEETAEIRRWVRRNGGTIGDRGRIPTRFLDAYNRNDPSIFAADEDEDQLSETAVADNDFEDDTRELVGSGSGVGDPFAS